MSDDLPQDGRKTPVYAFSDPEPRRPDRRWIIAVVVIAALVIGVVALIVFLQRPDGAPSATPSASATRSVSASATPTPSASAGTTDAPTPTPTLDQPQGPENPGTEPPVSTPDDATFREAVKPRLDDALTGLDMLGQLSGSEATTVVDQLAQDAMVLSDTVAPAAVGEKWHAAAADYIASLAALREAYGAGDASRELPVARANAAQLRGIAGL